MRQRRNENVGAHLYLIGAELKVLGGKAMGPWPRERHRFFSVDDLQDFSPKL